MKIVQESKRALLNLYEEFSKNESAYSPSIEISMKEFADSMNVSKENLNLYLWFLSDAGYIKCECTDYNHEDDLKNIFLLPNAIRLAEEDRSI